MMISAKERLVDPLFKILIALANNGKEAFNESIDYQ